jgi:DUF4097 and DUF4098 domain-containing protein YvlB
MLRAETLAAGALVLAAAGLTAAPAAAQVTGRFDRTLKVSGPVTLSISSGSGSVNVTPAGDGTVRVVGTIRGNSWRRLTSDSVERAVRAVEAAPPIVQSGSNISLGEGDRDDEDIRRHVSISWEVTAPTGTSLTVKTGSGSQQIGAFAGPVMSTAGSGSIEIGAIGGTVDVRTGSGSIDVDGARDRVNASAGSGSIAIGKVTGKVAIDTGSGSITVRDAPEATIDVTTGSGSIDVSGLVGGLTARAASGSVHVNGKPTSDWQLHSSSGDIVLSIPEGSNFRVQAGTSSGSINTDHKLTVTRLGRRELSGEVGSGGALVSARTSSGSIRIGR